MLTRRMFAFAGLFLALTGAASLPAQGTPAPATKSVTAAPAANAQVFDLNTATPQQLKTLPGIGDAFAKKIIDGRPYTMKNQLAQRGILPQATYDKIKDNVVAKRPATATSASPAKK